MPVRAASDADIEAIMDIERQPGFETLVARSSAEQHRTSMAAEDCRYLVLEDSAGVAQGFAVLTGVGSASGVVYLKRIAIRNPGHGSGTEFLNAVIGLVFETFGAEKFWLDAFETNSRARHVYEKCGMLLDGVLREHYPLADGSRANLVVMSILKREWTLRKAAAT